MEGMAYENGLGYIPTRSYPFYSITCLTKRYPLLPSRIPIHTLQIGKKWPLERG